MPNKIFEALLEEKITIFKTAFSALSHQLFYDSKSSSLIHPGEYGMYRESICKQFLRFVVPRNLSIEQGFIIDNADGITTQCDIIIYDSQVTPLIEDGERQRFFPAHSVAAVGEVKSTLNRSELTEALIKLSSIKKIKYHLGKQHILRSDNKEFSPKENHTDQLVTFLICKKLNFGLDKICDELAIIYRDISCQFRHNFVLSIDDGILLYSSDGNSLPYSNVKGHPLKNRFIKTVDSSLHLKIFCSNIFLTTSSSTILMPEIADFMGTNGSGSLIIDQTN